ncbi:hypothetical protein EBZ38_17035 [bacterium]|nr:hypothetical protein [bacterium]
METIMIMKNYVADELSNKVYHLHKALEQAQKIILVLEEENKKLKKIADHILSESNKDPAVAA